MLKTCNLVKNFIALLFIALALPSCYMARAYKFRKLKLEDHTKLKSTQINIGAETYSYILAANDNYRPITNWIDSNIVNTSTKALLVIKNDSIVYERYFDNYTKNTVSPSFSVAKSFVSTLIGIALDENKIKSTDEPFTNYLPYFLKKDERFANITIQHLLDMRSGIKWNEDAYGLKDDAIKLGFRPNMIPYIKKIKIASKPCEDSAYKSINTMLLGMILTKVYNKPLSKILEEKMWQPMGMETTADWNTDNKKLEITYGGLNATARDFTKLGSLFLHKGILNNNKIISEAWINKSTNADTLFNYDGYKNQWWGKKNYFNYTDSVIAQNKILELKQKNSIFKYRTFVNKSNKTIYQLIMPSTTFFAEGILGQFVYVCPDKNLIIVRLGQNWNSNKYYLQGMLQEIYKKY